MRGRGKRIDRREKGWKCPNFQTKLEILLCLMEGEKSKSEIRGYLKTALAIYDRSGIDRQLNELEEEGYIVRRREEQHVGKGLPPAYFRLADKYNTYAGFKELYNYFSIHSKGLKEKHNVQKDFLLEFQKSLYTQNTISEPIFPEMAKDMLKALGYTSLRLSLADEADFEKIFKIENLEDRKVLMKEFNNPTIAEIKETITHELEPFIGKSEYDAKRNEIIREKVGKFFDGVFADPSTLKFAQYIPLIFFPLNEQKDIVNILKSSPSALSLMITLQDAKFERLMMIWKAYFDYYFPLFIYLLHEIQDELYIGKEDDKKHKAENLIALIKAFLQDQTSWKVASTPALIMLKSLLISDIFSIRIVQNDWLGDYYKRLFIPDKEFFERAEREVLEKFRERRKEASP